MPPQQLNFYNGMIVTVPLVTRLLKNQPSLQEIHAALTNYYQGETYVRVIPLDGTKGISQYALDPTLCNGTNYSEIFVLGMTIKFLSHADWTTSGRVHREQQFNV
ncbi:N-acetyl-gamma-glutamylphosphate reductase [Paenibacillus sp. V4I7]|nr:N-acetyl-gamma-glutamylphosphate reductase [Paenibacillus sp. V4I7]